MDQYVLSALLALTTGVWLIVTVKREIGYRTDEQDPVRTAETSELRDVSNETA